MRHLLVIHFRAIALRKLRFVAAVLAMVSLLPVSSISLLAQSDAEDGRITGRVLNARTGRYVNQAEISVQGTNIREFTNQFGEYEFYGLEPGVYTVHADFTGLTRQSERVTVTSGETATANFTMGMRRQDEDEGEGEIFELAEFVVDANDFQSMQEIAIQEERFSVNLKNVVAADAYGTVAQGNVGEFVKFIPGVQVNYGGTYASGADASSISIRGYGAEQTGVTIDGIPVSNAQPGSLSRTVGLDMLSINNAARVEVIKVPTPDQPETSIAGTVNLVSKTAFEYPEPKLSYRVYVSINSENTDFFKKTPGPVDKSTYKTLPGFDLTYAWPINDKIGFTFTLATSNQFNENQSFDADWQTSPRSEPVPRFVEPDGTVIEPVYPDGTRPFLNNIQISDAPRFSHRHSGAVKMDYRPFAGVLVTANYQVSFFDSAEADRLFEMNAGGGSGIESYGEDFMISKEGTGKSDIIVRALDRDGVTHTGYLKASYIKGPWDARAHVSYSTSEGNLISADNGHFSEIQVGMGGIERAEFLNIQDGIPGEVNYYDEEGNTIDPSKLESYTIAGYDPADPSASSLRVLAGETYSTNEIQTYKIDVQRDIDFLPFKWMSLSIKAGAYREETTEEKTGKGTGYGYQFLGESGVTLELADFRDDGYVGVDPGFGFDPREWPDTYKVYDFFKDNPEAFSDTFDIPAVNESGDLENTIAAQNWINFVNTQKSITETKTDWYWQIRSAFFNNKLEIVGGMRQSNSTREGRTRFRNNDYGYLHTGEDANGDGLLDILDPTEFGNVFLEDANSLLVEDMQAFEALGVTYSDGTPFRAGFSYTGEPMSIKDIGTPRRERLVYYRDVQGVDVGYITPGTLAQQQLFLLPNYEVDEESKGRPSPIVSASYDLTDAIVLRASWARSFAKRDFEGAFGLLTSGGVQINQLSQEIVITNPDLKPWEADSYDFGVSYYTNSGGKFTASYFLKQERDHHVSINIPITEDNFETLLPEFGLPPDPDYHEDDWVIRTTENGEGTAETTGYEFEVSQSLGILGNWGKYFYVYASYTWKERTQSETVEGDPVGPSSDKFAAGGINFNYGPFSARVNATWRTERFLRGTSIPVLRDPTQPPGDDLADGEPNELRVPASLLEPAELKIDINLSYRISDRFSVDLSARNITNTKQERIFRSEDDAYPVYAEIDSRKQFGVQYTIGFSGEF